MNFVRKEQENLGVMTEYHTGKQAVTLYATQRTELQPVLISTKRINSSNEEENEKGKGE